MGTFRNFKLRVNLFFGDCQGATAIEYALIAALIALSILLGVRQLGSNIYSNLENVSEKLSGAGSVGNNGNSGNNSNNGNNGNNSNNGNNGNNSNNGNNGNNGNN